MPRCPVPGSGAAYAALSHALSMVFKLHAEAGLLGLLKLNAVRRSKAQGDWLPRIGNGAGLSGYPNN